MKIGGNAPDLANIVKLGDGNGYHSTWNTPESFTRYIKGLDKSTAWTKSGWDSGAEFHGTETMEQAIDLAENGWKEGMRRVERLRNRIAAENPMVSRAVRYDIAGSVPSVPRAVAGNIFNMKAPDLAKSKRRPIITLVSNMAANCGVDQAVFGNRAAVVAAIVDSIESKGFAVELITTAPTKGNSWGGSKGFRSAISIVVKKSDQYADLSRMGFALGHSAMFRRLCFADWGTEGLCKEGLGRGLGSNLELKQEDGDEIKGMFYLPSPEENYKFFKDEETAAKEGLEFLIKSLRQQKCPAFNPITQEEQDAWDAEKKKIKTVPRWDDDD